VKEAKSYAPVIVVDDGSNDNTAAVAKEAGATVLHHTINVGKGAALKTGCDYAVKQGAERLVVMDADDQHDPKLIPNFLHALEKSPMVYGYRVGFEEDMPFIKRMGNFVINSTMKILYGTPLQDTQSGFRAFTAKVYKVVRWNATDYSMESEMIARASKKNIPYEEIPISTIYRETYKGTSIGDGIKIVFDLVVWKFSL
tara:strand:+ start:254 stop:850 length:597 start_codon:yes stop_codon:yes gene_type:complete